VDRLTAIKNVAGKFVAGDPEGDQDLGGRFSDLVGLITFAGFADGVTPPTLDHGFVVANLNKTEIVEVRSEDGTAIGDAIALAVEKLNALDGSNDGDQDLHDRCWNQRASTVSSAQPVYRKTNGSDDRS